MNHQTALRNAKEFVKAQDGSIAPLSVSEEELNPDVQDDMSVHAFPLESCDQPHVVPYEYPADCGESEFAFFEDGRQRTIQIGHIPTEYGSNVLMIPVHYFIVAAVILQRNERQLSVWQHPRMREGIFVARSLVPDQQRLEEFEKAGLDIVDTAVLGGDYYDMRRRALRIAKDLRLEVEQELISEWRKASLDASPFLVVDGTLMNMREEENVQRCVGVSKSFGSRYFDVSTHNRILRLKEGERSWTFQFHDKDDATDDRRKGQRERVSWYLRLRDKTNGEPEFGLVRVEMAKEYSDRSTEFANRFSKSLMSDRLPTSYPAPRWDKHLYPIRACENYLSSVMPSISTITSSMGG